MIVLDASALVDVVIDQASKSWVLDQLETDTVIAPAHQLAEVLSALARLVRAGEMDLPAASDAAAEARRLEQDLLSPTAAQLVRALDLQDRVRVLDALYVVLAQDYDAPLITTDERLARTPLSIEVRSPASA